MPFPKGHICSMTSFRGQVNKVFSWTLYCGIFATQTFLSHKHWIESSSWGHVVWKSLHKNKIMKTLFFIIKLKLSEECKHTKAREGDIKSFSKVFLQSFTETWDKPKMARNLKSLKPIVSAIAAQPKGKRRSRKMPFLLVTK